MKYATRVIENLLFWDMEVSGGRGCQKKSHDVQAADKRRKPILLGITAQLREEWALPLNIGGGKSDLYDSLAILLKFYDDLRIHLKYPHELWN